MRFEGFCLLVVTLGRHKRPMAEERRRHANVLGISDRKCRGRGVAKKMWIHRCTECLPRMPTDAIVDGNLRHRRPVRRNPKRIADRLRPASNKRAQKGPMDIKIYPQWIDQCVGPYNLQGCMRLGVRRVKGDQPGAVDHNEILMQSQARQISASQWDESEQPDDQSVAMENGSIQISDSDCLID